MTRSCSYTEPPVDPVLRFRPPRIALFLGCAGLVLHWLAPLELHRGSITPAVLALLAGTLLMLRAWWLFRRAGTAICPGDSPTLLVAIDVYGYTRNPMYIGMVVMLVSAGIATGAVTAYAAALVFWAITDRHFVPHEESELQRAFGAAWSDYRKRVRRWL